MSRFEIIEKEVVGLGRKILVIVDKTTGVNYMFFEDGYGGGLTPLLNENGKPVITK